MLVFHLFGERRVQQFGYMHSSPLTASLAKMPVLEAHTLMPHPTVACFSCLAAVSYRHTMMLETAKAESGEQSDGNADLPKRIQLLNKVRAAPFCAPRIWPLPGRAPPSPLLHAQQQRMTSYLLSCGIQSRLPYVAAANSRCFFFAVAALCFSQGCPGAVQQKQPRSVQPIQAVQRRQPGPLF